MSYLDYQKDLLAAVSTGGDVGRETDMDRGGTSLWVSLYPEDSTFGYPVEDPDLRAANITPATPSKLHVTLFYFGAAENFEAPMVAVLRDILRELEGTGPLDAGVQGLDVFRSPEDAAETQVLLLTSQALVKFQSELAKTLDAFGMPYSKKFAYRPHVSLAYRDADIALGSFPSPNLSAFPGYIRLNRLELEHGEESWSWRL